MRGREAWILYSIVVCSCFVSLVTRLLLARAGRFQLSLVVVLLFVELLWWGSEAKKGDIAGSFVNNPGSYLICSKTSAASPDLVAIVVTAKSWWTAGGLEVADGDEVHQQRRFSRSYAAHGIGRREVLDGSFAAHCHGRRAVFPGELLLL